MDLRTVVVLARAVAVATAGCGGTDENTEPVTADDASVTATSDPPDGTVVMSDRGDPVRDGSTPAAAGTTESTDATSPATVSTDVSARDDLAGAIGVATQFAMDGTVLPAPEPACFDKAVGETDADTQQAADELIADPLSWYRIRPEQRRPLASAYVGCADIDDVLMFLALGTVNALEPACVAEAWSGVLTADMIASSLATGRGLDDLPPDVVIQLVAGARPCLPDDAAWWIDDVALELDGQHGMSTEQVACVAPHFVETLGIDLVLERRVLTVPMLTLPDTELVALQDACGVTITLPPMSPGAAGDCLADVFDDEQPDVVACDQPHNAEILTTVDLADEFPAWPGLAAIDDRSRQTCLDAANQAAPDRDDVGVIWFAPTRQVWLRGGRHTSCIIGPIDGNPWTSPSGITPTPTTTPSG